MADQLLMDWYHFTKSQECAACGAYPPTEAAHVRVMLSDKTGEVLGRSHKGRAAYGCIPLCKECHATQHEWGEARFAAMRELDYGRIVATNLVRFFVEEEGV